MIQYQILQTSITRTIWQTVRRNTNEILGVKGLILTQIFTNEEPPFSGNTVIVSSLSLLLEIQRFKLCNFNPASKTTITTFPQTICELFMITNYNNHHNNYCVTNLF